MVRQMTPRLQAAIDVLEKKGLPKSAYAPPFIRGLWSLGLEVPPPFLASFAANAAFAGLAFAPTWGLLMWLLVWNRQGMKPLAAFLASVLAGALFGIFMAWYLRRQRLKHGLPLWKDISAPP
jgi:hypothetical protein